MAEKTLPWPADTRLVRLGEIEIDPRYRSVSRAGVVHELNPRCFELLLLFLNEPRVLHTRDAIFRKVWRGAVVEDANLTTSIWLLRRALGGGAKQWIRTISKQGYIFDPPAGVEFELCTGETPLVPTAGAAAESPASMETAVESTAAPIADATPAAMPPPANTAPAITRGRAVTLAAAASLALMLLTGGLLGARSRDNTPMRVVLVAAADGSLPETQRWPARLLQHWLGWQLEGSPRVELRNPSDVVSDGSETVVLVDLAAPAQGSEWRISAHFRGSVTQTPIVRRAAAKDLVAAIASLSNEVFARLTATEDYSGPLLSLDVASAQQLADAIEAEEQHRWGDAVRSYTGVVTAAPEMGFARFHLARSLNRLGQRSAAQAELARATAWMEGLPEFLRAPLQAESLSIRENHAEAALAFAALNGAQQETRTEHRVAEARSLRRTGRSREASDRLGNEVPLTPSTAVGWLTERAAVDIANREFRNAITSATQALELAQTLGWEHDRALAALALTDARINSGEAAEIALLAQAEQGFAASGDRLGVLVARVRAELERHHRAPDELLNQLLAEAHAAGNASIEIEMLQRVGRARFRAGDAREAHERFIQAAAVADSSGNHFERRRIDMALLQLDLLRLDFTGLDRRLTLLESETQQGTAAYVVGGNRARLQYWRGEFDGALRTLEDTESRLRKSNAGNLPQSMAALNCMRAAVGIVQGRPADARTEFRNCRSTGMVALDHLADIGEAELAIQAGDVAQARRLLQPMQETQLDTPAEPDRWGLTVEVVPLLARIGEFTQAKTMIDQTLPLVQQAGYHMLETNLRATRAEIALGEGRVDDAEREIELVEKLSPPDYWNQRRRIRTVRALVTQARGKIEAAAQELDALHTDTRAHGDVLGELLVHTIMDANPAASRCPDERRLRLLATSGMRGASDLWMNPASRERAHLVSAATGTIAVTP